MRSKIAILSLALALLWALPAYADSVFFTPDTPIEAGVNIKGLLRQPNGLTALADIYVEGTIEDDMFTYWVGSYNGEHYYYDIYSTYWMPGPVSYIRSTLTFQKEKIEGWVRQFGGKRGMAYPDYNHFFGSDGVLYKRVVIERNRTRGTNKRRKVIYSYFVNMQTLERSDSHAPSYLVIGGGDRSLIDEQMKRKEETFARIVQEIPAFPLWQTTAFEAPDRIVVHNGAVENDDNLIVLGDSDLGSLKVEDNN
ncbi:hypothetical protein IT575_05505 [bacterium]|nr:hypothetical protein [bacterium]